MIWSSSIPVHTSAIGTAIGCTSDTLPSGYMHKHARFPLNFTDAGMNPWISWRSERQQCRLASFTSSLAPVFVSVKSLSSYVRCSPVPICGPSPLLELFPATPLWIFFPCWLMWTGEYVLSAFDLPVDHLYTRAVTLLGYSGFISMLEEPKTAHWDKGDEVTGGPC